MNKMFIIRIELIIKEESNLRLYVQRSLSRAIESNTRARADRISERRFSHTCVSSGMIVKALGRVGVKAVVVDVTIGKRILFDSSVVKTI